LRGALGTANYLAMANDRAGGSRPRVVQDIASVGGRAAARTLRPFTGAVTAAANAGIDLERRTLDRVLASDELERVLMTTLQSPHLQAALGRAFASDGASKLVDSFFDSGLFDRLVDRLLASDGLWRLIDEIAASPAVRAAISQQGLGFADQVGNELRVRSRKGDALVERVAQRIVNRRGDAG
jgi:hypothetical protein